MAAIKKEKLYPTNTAPADNDDDVSSYCSDDDDLPLRMLCKKSSSQRRSSNMCSEKDDNDKQWVKVVRKPPPHKSNGKKRRSRGLYDNHDSHLYADSEDNQCDECHSNEEENVENWRFIWKTASYLESRKKRKSITVEESKKKRKAKECKPVYNVYGSLNLDH